MTELKFLFKKWKLQLQWKNNCQVSKIDILSTKNMPVWDWKSNYKLKSSLFSTVIFTSKQGKIEKNICTFKIKSVDDLPWGKDLYKWHEKKKPKALYKKKNEFSCIKWIFQVFLVLKKNTLAPLQFCLKNIKKYVCKMTRKRVCFYFWIIFIWKIKCKKLAHLQLLQGYIM